MTKKKGLGTGLKVLVIAGLISVVGVFVSSCGKNGKTTSQASSVATDTNATVSSQTGDTNQVTTESENQTNEEQETAEESNK